MAMQTGLEGKPWYYGVAAGVVVAAAIVAAVWYFMIEPKNKEIAEKERQLAGLQVKIQEGRAAKQKLPQFREEVRRLEDVPVGGTDEGLVDHRATLPCGLRARRTDPTPSRNRM